MSPSPVSLSKNHRTEILRCSGSRAAGATTGNLHIPAQSGGRKIRVHLLRVFDQRDLVVVGVCEGRGIGWNAGGYASDRKRRQRVDKLTNTSVGNYFGGVELCQNDCVSAQARGIDNVHNRSNVSAARGSAGDRGDDARQGVDGQRSSCASGSGRIVEISYGSGRGGWLSAAAVQDREAGG